MRLLLASQSETRRRMLEAAGVPFEIAATDLDEDAAKADLAGSGLAPHALAGRLAMLKARGAATPADALVLGADQLLEQDDGTILAKPRSREDAAAQLRGLSGRVHRLHSAAAVVERGQCVWAATETAMLTMRSLSEPFITAYLDAEYEAVRWNVGGYAIEGRGAQLFDAVEGSHFVILGLPLLPLLAYLRTRGLLPG